MPRERLTFAVVRSLLALALMVAFSPALPGEAATGQSPATTRPDLGSPDAPPPHLGARDVELYRQVFALQERADWAGADG
jgi:hypothetical protein